ncbi:MAG: ACT domain-containing protein [Desulfovibrio sp.]|nr:ACT domain-containing protein [Desulfovibrio sp.]
MSSSIKSALTMLRLSVNNHPGVMSHICGLFAGRAYNLEGILVTPEAGGETCRMWLVVKDDGRMDQIVKQVRKLHDVLDVRVGQAEPAIFSRLAGCLEC